MEITNITKDLNRRFSEPLPEFYRRRIIFWYDEDREFEDKLDEIQLNNAKLVILTGSNSFYVKKLLCADDTESNYLVYNPLTYDCEDDNWLINIQLYSEEFRADLNSIWMDEMGLPPKPDFRRMVKGYHKFFDNAKRRASVAALSGRITTAGQLHLAVMAALSGSDTQPSSIIRNVLKAGLDKDENKIYQNFVKYKAHGAFWLMVNRFTGYNEGDDAQLGRLATHIMLTAASRTIAVEHLAGLDELISTPHQAFCYDFVSDWLHSTENDELMKVAYYVEREARLFQRLQNLSVDDLVDTECFPCVNECVLMSLMTEISNQIIDVESIRSVVEKRRSMVWYAPFACYYDGILQVANMQRFFREHSAGFHTAEPWKLWKAYTEDYYRMDTYYRQFHLCFQRSLKASHPLLDDLFKNVVQKVEGLYVHWFLGELGSNWSNISADTLAEVGRVPEISQQTGFYREKVAPATSRVFVIVSDALRYEVAASLAEELRRDTQSKVDLKSCEGIFPTVTKYGMAALLPHQKLELVEKNGSLSILADGQSTEAGNREAVLKNRNKNSVVLKYENFITMNRAARMDAVRGSEVVYIYHDKIDLAGHQAHTGVFAACEESVNELKNLVKIIGADYATNIIITSDHGFLYTYSPLQEDDKVNKTTESALDVEVDRRYLITRSGAKPEYLMPVRFMGSDTGYDAFAPREMVRIKKKGGGLNFVHGGASLQEMVVPVVECRYLRSATKTYQRNRDEIDTKPVSVSLLSSMKKVSNMIFSLSFYQNEAVGGNRSSTNYQVYFMDAAGNRVSDINRIIADKTSTNNQERTFRCNFNLKSQNYNKHSSYYLVIEDESGLQAPVKVEFQIDIAFAFDDFGFDF